MLRKLSKLINIFLLLLIINASVFCKPLDDIKICLDPGHGGTDSGAVGPTGLKESDENLIIANKLYNLLLNNGGAEIKMTRESDIDISLPNRATFANNNGVHWFISIHLNASTNPDANYSKVFYLKFNSSNMATPIVYYLSTQLNIDNSGTESAAFVVINDPAASCEVCKTLIPNLQIVRAERYGKFACRFSSGS